MIASLGMYDHPAQQAANDRFWSAIRARLGDGPERLSRDRELWDIWQSPDLLFAQTCGLPFRARLHDRVTPIGTADYGLDGCPPGHYRSLFVTRGKPLAELTDGTFAFNDTGSESGWAGPFRHLESLGLTFAKKLETGAHAQSARDVAEGRADAAAIDAQTWRTLSKHDPWTKELTIVDATPPTPGLLFITAQGRDPEPLYEAVSGAIDDMPPEDRETLGVKGMVKLPASDYLAVRLPAEPA